MFRFEHPHLLWLLAIIPVMLLMHLFYRRWRKRALNLFGEYDIVRKLMPDTSEKKARIKILLQLAGFFFIIVAAANPQFGTRIEEVKTSGIDISVALDISNSMLAEDLKPNRLERAKQLLSKIIEELDGDRFGLVVFAGEAFVQLPLTTDYPAASLFLHSLTPDVIATQGTAIGNAISLSIQSLENSREAGARVILVISDGENHEDDAVRVAGEAARQGIQVFTAGIGSPEGVPIPHFQEGKRIGFKKDQEGNTVVTKLNEEVLKNIAEAGNGSYVRVSDSRAAQQHILDELSLLEEGELVEQKVSEYESYFQYFLALALICWTADYFVIRRRLKRSSHDEQMHRAA